MKDALAALDVSSKKLNEKTDSLNKLIEQLEKRLQASQVGVSVWLDSHGSQMLDASPESQHLDPNNEPVGDLVESTGWVLGFAKVAEAGTYEWRIAVHPVRQIWTPHLVNDWQTSDFRTLSEGEPRPLLKAPRAVRVEAAGLLETLVKQIAERAASFAEDIEKAEGLVVDDGTI